MRIKKMYQGTVPENKIVGTYTESDTDTYNCNYANNTFREKGTILFNGTWNRETSKTFDTSSYSKLEFVLVIPSPNAGNPYSTRFTIMYDNSTTTGLISGITKCMDGFFYQCEIQKRSNTEIYFDYGAYAKQDNMNNWTVYDGGYIAKVIGYK